MMKEPDDWGSFDMERDLYEPWARVLKQKQHEQDLARTVRKLASISSPSSTPGPSMKIPNVAVVTKSWTIAGLGGELTISEVPDRCGVKVSIRSANNETIRGITLTLEGWEALATLRWEVKVDTATAEAEAAARALGGGDSGESGEGQGG